MHKPLLIGCIKLASKPRHIVNIAFMKKVLSNTSCGNVRGSKDFEDLGLRSLMIANSGLSVPIGFDFFCSTP